MPDTIDRSMLFDPVVEEDESYSGSERSRFITTQSKDNATIQKKPVTSYQRKESDNNWEQSEISMEFDISIHNEGSGDQASHLTSLCTRTSEDSSRSYRRGAIFKKRNEEPEMIKTQEYEKLVSNINLMRATIN